MENVPDTDFLTVVLDNENSAVSALYGTNFLSVFSRRQSGSTLKPLAVYAPALESGSVMPDTEILDEPTDFNGYSPKNYDGKHYGLLTVREALADSNNVVAVKILEKIGVEYSKNFLAKNGIHLDKKDSGLSVALGGLTYGTTLLELADGFSTLAKDGLYSKSAFVRAIIGADGRPLYVRDKKEARAMSEKTAKQILTMLDTGRQTGTARRLKDFEYGLAVKTGTVGTDKDNRNRDAYCISATTTHTIAVRINSINTNGMEKRISGSTYPAVFTEKLLEEIYVRDLPERF
jgi:penicillin-binding protein 2A